MMNVTLVVEFLQKCDAAMHLHVVTYGTLPALKRAQILHKHADRASYPLHCPRHVGAPSMHRCQNAMPPHVKRQSVVKSSEYLTQLPHHSRSCSAATCSHPARSLCCWAPSPRRACTGTRPSLLLRLLVRALRPGSCRLLLRACRSRCIRPPQRRDVCSVDRSRR